MSSAMVVFHAHAQLSSSQNLALLVLRVALGAMIFSHGFNKVFGGGGLSGTAGWFDSIGMKPGALHARAAAGTELVAGLLLMAGFATPFACAGLIAVMLVAIVTVHRKNGWFIFNANGGGIEYCAIIALAAGSLSALGPGKWSIDKGIIDWAYTSHVGLFIGVALGIGGAALQLAAFYRPPKA